MKLQMDGTLNYSKYSHIKVTPHMIKNDESSYNTYKFKGLPSDPICAIEFESIKAAIFPVKSDYLYFMKSSDGTKHNFSSSYRIHKRNVRQVQKEKRRQKRKEKVLNAQQPIYKTVQTKKKIIKKTTDKKVSIKAQV